MNDLDDPEDRIAIIGAGNTRHSNATCEAGECVAAAHPAMANGVRPG